ncbi:iron-sulfur cluster carrier protein ApbC [Chitinibacter bivalviorum]|uniref:Iron-sulfur cluster carrier protein n=1 Tax=Chitinibacter bivalviorum TaxID=2739434 RepID=A0A7H9BFW2_9NEIS|nr:iron-sulfur cluster carrier protein ApbC [Chitinibacter bivalviorum]QLG87312.1 iron-sulfur cluster carrier protein ApbC [Chitinibacter bivalviorum]
MKLFGKLFGVESKQEKLGNDAVVDLLLDEVKNVLAALIDPDTGKDYLTSKNVKNLVNSDGAISLDLILGYPAQSQFAAREAQIVAALSQISGVKSVAVKVSSVITAHAVARGIPLQKGVKNIIAVASGKGGVGKSTTSVNLALALAAEGAKVGLLDADIYGPSQPTMMGVADLHPESIDNKYIKPIEKYGVMNMSIGFLIDPEQPMVWRGPMVTQALTQLLNDTLWGELDYLVIDLPPGTGDIQLTLSQKVPVTGAVIVTTPQDIALLDARKGLKMFEKVGVPILGIVENMSMHVCSNCGHIEPIFGEGGGAKMSADYGTELIGKLPLDLSIRLNTDAGKPSVVAEPDGEIAAIYKAIARKVAVKVAAKSQDFSSKFPKIVIQNT